MPCSKTPGVRGHHAELRRGDHSTYINLRSATPKNVEPHLPCSARATVVWIAHAYVPPPQQELVEAHPSVRLAERRAVA